MKSWILALPLLSLAMAGCATTTTTTGSGDASPAARTLTSDAAPTENKQQVMAPVATVDGGLPGVELEEGMLYDLLLADIAAKRGHLDKSVELYRDLAERTQDPRLAERATRVALFARREKDALTANELWVRLDPNNLEARQSAAALYIRDGQEAKALEQLEAIFAQTGQTEDNGYMLIAGLLSREKDKRMALDLMRQFVAKRPKDPDALFAYSHLASRLGELDEANASIDKVLALKPDWTEAILQKARILRAEGKTAQALEYMNKVIESAPDVAQYRLAYARMLADEDRFEDAYQQFAELNKLQPGSEDVVFALGFLGLQLGRLDEAEAYFLQLREAGNRSDEVVYYLGRLEEERGDNNAAKKWYEAVPEGEHYINAQVRVVVIKARVDGDLAGARAHLDALKAQRPAQKLRLTLVEGEILTEAEQYDEAMTVYDASLDEFPDNTDLLYARAMTAEKLNNLELLESDLRQILARNPSNAEALNALGYTLADRTDRLEEAKELVERALELKPGDFYVLDSMGWVNYRMGRYEEAVKFLRRALELKMDGEVAAHLGEVLWVMGDKEGAREVWQRALSAPKAKTKVITEVMERLEK